MFPNLPSSSGNITQYPENLYLNEETFDGSTVDGCQLNGNTYLCKAWNEVELSGEFTVANNYDVLVEGGEQVTVLPESVTPPEMTWQVVPVLDYSNPTPPVDASYISTFCQNSNEYQARQGTKSLIATAEDSTTTDERRISNNFAFNIFPNPTSGRTTVSITLDEAAQGELFITDVNGRKLGSGFNNKPLGAGQSEYQLPTQALSSGIYLVHLFIEGEHHVKRLVKQ